jgi:hypothetical protein
MLMLRRPAFVDPAMRLASLVRPCLLVVEAIIGLHVIFKALASEDVGFVAFITTISGPLVAPWRGIVGDAVEGTHVIESGALIAMGVYAIVATLLVRALRGVMARPRI